MLLSPPALLKSTEHFSTGCSYSVLIMDTVDLHPLLEHLEGNIDDLEDSERQAREEANAHIKFDELSERIKQEEISKNRKASAVEGLTRDEEAESSSEDSRDSEPPSAPDKGVEANAPRGKGKGGRR